MESEIDQKAQPLGEFLDDARGNLAAPAGQGAAGKKRQRLGYRQRGQFGQAALRSLHAACTAVEPRAATIGAGPGADALAPFPPHPPPSKERRVGNECVSTRTSTRA